MAANKTQEGRQRTVWMGGRGGGGGPSPMVGGGGGNGEGPRMMLEEATQFAAVRGGTGGDGGSGGQRGGDGGVGQRPELTAPLVTTTKRVPKMALAAFCKEYELDDTILRVLQGKGYSTVGALCAEFAVNLTDAGLTVGQIAELKQALKQFLSDKNAV
ncbi:hypothetical protein C8R44DRAFT_741195 [Mycena epipterygia]|nr:hypothetical protein C8R44DRAFT_741195 [Mycena epipterygia]